MKMRVQEAAAEAGPLAVPMKAVAPAHIDRIETLADAIIQMSERSSDVGYHGFTVLDVLYTDGRPQTRVVVESASSKESSHLESFGLAAASDLFEVAFEFSSPFRWRSPESPETAMLDVSPLLFREASGTFAQGAGLCIPVHSGINRAGAVIFFGDGKPNLTMNEICALRLFCLSWFAKLSHLSIDRAAKKRVTAREIQCLQMAGVGLTSEGIATALGLSKHTVNHHLISAAVKMDAVNRTHAVAKGVRMGLIR